MARIYAYLLARIKSFGYAFKGIGILFRSQPNAQIHILAVAIITALGWFFQLQTWEWCVIILCIAIVILAEALNTAIEFLTDLASPEYHPLAGKAKDVAAGAVLLTVIVCGIAWALIFVPKITKWFISL